MILMVVMALEQQVSFPDYQVPSSVLIILKVACLLTLTTTPGAMKYHHLQFTDEETGSER